MKPYANRVFELRNLFWFGNKPLVTVILKYLCEETVLLWSRGLCIRSDHLSGKRFCTAVIWFPYILKLQTLLKVYRFSDAQINDRHARKLNEPDFWPQPDHPVKYNLQSHQAPEEQVRSELFEPSRHALFSIRMRNNPIFKNSLFTPGYTFQKL